MDKINRALRDIEAEVIRAKELWTGEFKNTHEGYAVIKEEFDELWDEIRQRDQDISAMRKEAIQTAAMLVRFISELV